MLVLAWLVLLGLLAAYFFEMQQRQFNPNRELQTKLSEGRQVLSLKANKYNHFVMTGKINGIAVTFMLDTGATQVAVPASLAKKLGLVAGEPGIAATANGNVRVYSTRIDRLELGDILLQDVAAEINPGMNGMDEVLLGMSALSRLEFSQRDGVLEIRY